MNESKNVKALKKQLAAAIAMVCVAAVALGSSTYAWFVTNNKVDATTSTISAQSNAAFMYIRNDKNPSTDLRSDVASLKTNTELYPAHWSLAKESATYTEAGKFYMAYGTAATEDGYKMDKSTLKQIPASGDNDSNAEGSPATAVAGKYAVKNTFKVGSKGTTLSNLIVDENDNGISITGTGNEKLDNALRVLVTCGNKWVLCDKNSILGSSDNNKLADTVSATETTIDIYVFYDGDDTAIYTNNLGNLNTASKSIKVTFSATADNR